MGNEWKKILLALGIIIVISGLYWFFVMHGELKLKHPLVDPTVRKNYEVPPGSNPTPVSKGTLDTYQVPEGTKPSTIDPNILKSYAPH